MPTILKPESRPIQLDDRGKRSETLKCQLARAARPLPTEQYLRRWSEDKPRFQQVRQEMGRLLDPDPETGKAEIPLKWNGRIDLDAAYAKACENLK